MTEFNYDEGARKLATKLKKILQIKLICYKLDITYKTFWKKETGKARFKEREYKILKELSEAKVIDFTKRADWQE